MSVKTRTLRIRTPEGIVFPMQIAGPLARFLAWILDFVLVGGIVSILSVLLGLLRVIGPGFHWAVMAILSLALSLGYPILAEWRWRGQTLGKRVLKLRVIDQQGLRLQLSQVIIRNLLRFIDALPAFYLVGGLSTLLSPYGQRLGDIAGNTVVIRHPEIEEPDLDQILPDKFNSFREYAHLTARLRQHVSPEEAEIALQALMRRDALDPNARVELFGEIASHFREAVRFPQKATDGLSDEQYVRNIVDVLFKSDRPGQHSAGN